MENKNPMIRLVIFGKLKRMINSYKHMKLKTIDRRLLRGLFLRNLKDFDEEYIEKMGNKSLMMRLKKAMIVDKASFDEGDCIDEDDEEENE